MKRLHDVIARQTCSRRNIESLTVETAHIKQP